MGLPRGGGAEGPGVCLWRIGGGANFFFFGAEIPTKICLEESFCLRVTVMGNKAHEISAAWNYTCLDYTSGSSGGAKFCQNYTQNSRQ